MSNSTYTLDLSTEELAFLMDVLRIPYLHGVGKNPATELSDDGARNLFVAGFNSLRVRDLISVPSGALVPLVVESIVVASLATCAESQHVVAMLHALAVGNIETYYFHRSERLCVLHMQTEQNIHRFIGALDYSKILENIEPNFAFASKNSQNSKFRISLDDFNEITQAALKKNPFEPSHAISLTGIDSSDVEQFVGSVQGAVGTVTVSSIGSSEGNLTTLRGVVLLESHHCPWIIKDEMTDTEESYVTVTAADKSDCLCEVARLLNYSPLHSA